jgi:predicted ribosomally synthesized peptide with nif11-like leader
MSLENVRSFYEYLEDNEAFRDQIKAAENKEECSRIVKEAGFDFTLEEYEEYTYQLLESTNSEDEPPKWPPVQQMYGVVIGDTFKG